MSRTAQFVGQFFIYGALCVAVGALASWPRYEQFAPETAQIKLSLAHSAQRKEKCRRFTSKEIADLPPNERRPNTCKRERVPIRIQLLIDEKQVYDAVVEPVGLSHDGPARVYQKFVVPTGHHTITARLRDTLKSDGFDYEKKANVELKPHQSLAIDFSVDQGGFVFY
jgi:hypothetical protein